ncbi:MAG: OmpA family protein [Alphaproteobacteria bacterium]|nr:OmpA family protein [Alphaproteobacteria bacterium]
MRSKLLFAASTIALAWAGQAAAEPANGWYMGLEGGGNWVSENDATFSTSLPTSGPARIEFDTGWTGIATAGYAFRGNWRVEAEAGYRHNDVDAINGIANSAGGELNTTSLMGNVLYDIPLTDRMTVSLGAGAGAVHTQFDDGVIDQDEDTAFAYQGIAGLSYAVSPRTDLTMNYRYLRSDALEFQGRHAGHTDFYDTDDVQNHTVTIGLKFDLYPDQETVVASTAPMVDAPTPPPPQTAPKQFLVFFGFNRSDLTVEAQGVVADAAAAAKQFGSARIMVVAHADTVGSQQYNQRLSERRSSTVRKALVSQGIEANKIEASGRGETELLVQTADNVKEPQNRRANIELQ